MLPDEPKGLVFDIQGYSVHDGPGCRTVFFLNGCPLRCEWCANPEGMELRPTLLVRSTKCKRREYDCTRCMRACPVGAITPGADGSLLEIDRKACRTCTTMQCARACAHEALGVAGTWYSVSDLMRIVNRDRQYWGGQGGVTFTGGEPLLQREFILATLKKCHAAYVHTALETSACVDTDFFLQVMQHVDFAFIDVKHMNPWQHEQKTGVSNTLIVQNIRALRASRWPGRLVLRMPVIEGFNDRPENLAQLAAFMEEIGQHELNLLPFHRMGDSKWTQIGLVYPYRDRESTPMEQMQALQQGLLERGVACYVGSYTPF